MRDVNILLVMIEQLVYEAHSSAMDLTHSGGFGALSIQRALESVMAKIHEYKHKHGI